MTVRKQHQDAYRELRRNGVDANEAAALVTIEPDYRNTIAGISRRVGVASGKPRAYLINLISARLGSTTYTGDTGLDADARAFVAGRLGEALELLEQHNRDVINALNADRNSRQEAPNGR